MLTGRNLFPLDEQASRVLQSGMSEQRWDESSHPRDEHGKFGSGGGGSKGDGHTPSQVKAVLVKAGFSRSGGTAREASYSHPNGATAAVSRYGAGGKHTVTLMNGPKTGSGPHPMKVFLSTDHTLGQIASHASAVGGQTHSVTGTKTTPGGNTYQVVSKL